MIEAGRLDKRVVIERESVTRDAETGAESVTWETWATVWAEVLESETASLTGAQVVMAASARPSRVTVRHLAALTVRDRINIGGRLLQIIGIAEVGRREFTRLACKEWEHE